MRNLAKGSRETGFHIKKNTNFMIKIVIKAKIKIGYFLDDYEMKPISLMTLILTNFAWNI